MTNLNIQSSTLVSKSSKTKKRLVIAFFSLSNCFIATCVSLPAPFYPFEAIQKGATPGSFGFVLGVFELTVFICNPIFAKVLTKIEPTFIFSSGLFLTGITTIAFGFLDLIDNVHLFIGMSILLRVLQGVGESAFTLADFSISTCLYPESASTVFSIMETSWSLGIIIGPTLGGSLYGIGGFAAPFAAVGINLVVFAAISVWLTCADINFSVNPENNTKGVWYLLKIGKIRPAVLSIVLTTFSFGYLDAILGLHLSEYGLGPTLVGIVFIATGFWYGLSTLFWGFLIIKYFTNYYGLLIGIVLQTIGYMFFGPNLINNFQSSLAVDILMQCIIGIGMGGVLISAFNVEEQIALESGFCPGIYTYSIITAIWASSFSLGYFLGPTTMGLILDHTNITTTNYVMMFLFLSVVIYLIIFIHKEKIAFKISAEKLLKKDIPASIQNNYGTLSEPNRTQNSDEDKK